MLLLKINEYQGLIGALIGGSFALAGNILSNWLPRFYEKKAKSREAKSRIISNTIMQYRNIEKGVTYGFQIDMNKQIIVGINKGIIKNYSWSKEQIESNNIIMANEIDLLWKQNNQYDTELVHSLATLQLIEPDIANKISNIIYKFITWEAKGYDLSPNEVFKYIGNPEWESFSEIKRSIVINEYKILHNEIVSILDSPQLMKK